MFAIWAQTLVLALTLYYVIKYTKAANKQSQAMIENNQLMQDTLRFMAMPRLKVLNSNQYDKGIIYYIINMGEYIEILNREELLSKKIRIEPDGVWENIPKQQISISTNIDRKALNFELKFRDSLGYEGTIHIKYSDHRLMIYPPKYEYPFYVSKQICT